MIDDRNAIRRIGAKIWGRVNQFLHPDKLRLASWGNDFADKTFLVIRRREYGVGLFSYFQTNLGWINYALGVGDVPVIDMKKNRCIYHSTRFFRKNVWDYFFEQPCGYGIEDIRRAKNIVIADGNVLKGDPEFLPTLGECENVELNADLPRWRLLASRFTVPRTEFLQTFMSQRLEDALRNGGAIGVLARGTDYVRLHPRRHPVQPTLDHFFAAIEEYDCKDRSVKPIFLVTEDKNLSAGFLARYGERVILSRQDCIPYSKGFLYENKAVVGNLEKGLAYMKAVLDLSRCPVLIAGRTSGTLAAVLLSNGFSYSKVFNLGIY